MLIYSMSVSVDGFIADREGAFEWGVPSDELFRFHLDQVRRLGSCLLGRRLYETMLVWETDPSLRDNEDTDAFADVWGALPKVVFSRTLDSVQGNARLAEASVAEEVAAALDATDKDVEIGGAGLAAQAIELGLVDELRMFRYPIVVGGGTPFLPPVTDDIALELLETRTFGSRVSGDCARRRVLRRRATLVRPPPGDSREPVAKTEYTGTVGTWRFNGWTTSASSSRTSQRPSSSFASSASSSKGEPWWKESGQGASLDWATSASRP